MCDSVFYPPLFFSFLLFHLPFPLLSQYKHFSLETNIASLFVLAWGSIERLLLSQLPKSRVRLGYGEDGRPLQAVVNSSWPRSRTEHESQQPGKNSAWWTSFSTEIKQRHFRFCMPFCLLEGKTTICGQGKLYQPLKQPLCPFELETTNICMMSEHLQGTYWLVSSDEEQNIILNCC